MTTSPSDPNRFPNQCCLLIRVEGEELSLPLDFGLDAGRVQELYPYILQMCNNKVANPAMRFEAMDRAGELDGMPADEYDAALASAKRASRLWYGREDASLLEIALRLCVDLRMQGVSAVEAGLLGASRAPVWERTAVRVEGMPYRGKAAPGAPVAPVAPLAKAEPKSAQRPAPVPAPEPKEDDPFAEEEAPSEAPAPVGSAPEPASAADEEKAARIARPILDAAKGHLDPLPSDEATKVLTDHGLITPTDSLFDPGAEQDVPLGIGGDNAVNLYNSGAETEFMGAELDAREQRLALEDRFREVAARGGDSVPDGDPDPAASRPRLDAKESGAIHLYGGDDGESILDRLDREDGINLNDIPYEYDYHMGDGSPSEPIPAPPQAPAPATAPRPEQEGGGDPAGGLSAFPDGLGGGLDDDDDGGLDPGTSDEGGLPLGAVPDEDDGTEDLWDPAAEEEEARRRAEEEDESPEYDDFDDVLGGEIPVEAPPDGDGEGGSYL